MKCQLWCCKIRTSDINLGQWSESSTGQKQERWKVNCA